MSEPKEQEVVEEEPFLPQRSEDINDILEKELYSDHAIIWFDNDVDSDEIRGLIQKICYHAINDPEQEITIYLNTDGGDMYEVLRLYDFIHSIKNKVNIIVEGKAFSAGAWIAACCATGERLCLQHSTFMIHEGKSWSYGKFSDMKQDLKEMERLENIFVELLTKHTNLSEKEVRTLCVKDHYFNSEEALKNGFVDRVL